MYQLRINCKIANDLDLFTVMKKLGFHPERENNNSATYYSLECLPLM